MRDVDDDFHTPKKKKKRVRFQDFSSVVVYSSVYHKILEEAGSRVHESELSSTIRRKHRLAHGAWLLIRTRVLLCEGGKRKKKGTGEVNTVWHITSVFIPRS